MTLARIDIAVMATAAGWTVTATRNAAAIANHIMTRLGATQPAAAGGLDAQGFDDSLTAIRARSCSAAQSTSFGSHLYNALLAPMWSAIEQRLEVDVTRVELAIDLDASRELAYLPWELMRAPGGFLARGFDRTTGGVLEVAITRREPRAQVTARPLQHPLRYLFVIGSTLSDSVRAGAECFGLLRQIGDQFQERIVQRPSLPALGSIIERFAPDVVHVICHGEIDPATGAASLRMYDDVTGGEVTVGADLLAEQLIRKGTTPFIVLLSACASGAPLAAGACAPLASGLVRAGVPMVVAMAGEINDLACRLFARSFGEALAQRQPPVWAAGAGRRAALRSSALPADAVDWAMIDVFLGSDIASDVAVAPAASNPEAALVEGWLKRTDVDLRPSFGGKRNVAPFCGRLDVIEAFYELISNTGIRPPALCLTARPPKDDPDCKVGKLRTLTELAAIATREGHVVVPVFPSGKKDKGFPRDEQALVDRIATAIKKTRSAYGLTPVDITLSHADEDALIDALAKALIALRDDARAMHPFITTRNGQVIVMLHDVHEYGSGTPFLLHTLITNFGFGRAGAEVPVVLTFKFGDYHDDTFREVTESDKRRSALGVVELRPFGPTEDMLAYQRVLMQPYRDKPDIATKRWFLELRRDPALVEYFRGLFQIGTGGFPGKLWRDGFRAAVAAAMGPPGQPGIVREASDDDLLKTTGRVP